MSNTQNSSFSLLNQKEIDSLIGFLSEQKNSLDSDVLSQKSIDKLIKLISSDSDKIITDVFDPFAHVDNSVLATLGFREDVSQLCELKFSVNETTDYIILTAYNTVTNKELVITPNLINANDTTDWGCSISPVFFNRIAKVFSFKYTQQTHDAVCNCFAKHTYGDANHKIPEIYLPVNEKLLECLI